MAGFYEAEFTHTNEQLKQDSWVLHVDEIRFRAGELPMRCEVFFKGWTNQTAKDLGIVPRSFAVSFPIGFDAPELLGLLAANSEEIWARIWTVPFISCSVVENGQLKIESKSLADLGAEKRPVDLLSAMMTQTEGKQS